MQYALDLSQRWRNGRDAFVPPTSVFDPRSHGIEPIGRAVAAAFIAAHHYLGTCPVATRAYGLFRKVGREPARLVGCAVFGMPASQGAIPLRTGLPTEAGLELTRFVLLDEAEFNAESWALAQCLRDLARTRSGLHVVLAHSDPTPRVTRDGATVFAGHVGQIYAAGNATYAGRGARRTAHVTASGAILPDRLFSKVRRDGRGADGGERRLVELGLTPRAPHQGRREWLDAALAGPGVRRVSRPGVHAYVLPVTATGRSALRALPAIARPTRRDAPIVT